MASSRSRSSRGVRFGGSVRLLALFLFGVVFFSAMIDQAEGLKCHFCGKTADLATGRNANLTQPKGRSGLTLDFPSCKNGIGESLECAPGALTCAKFSAIGTQRACAYVSTTGCKKDEEGREQCFCKGDNCNDASFGSESGGKPSKPTSESTSSSSSMSSIGGIFIFIISTMVASISATMV